MPDFHVPKMSHHRASGQAIVRLNGRDFYLGPWKSKAATIEYDRLVAEWLANGRKPHEGQAEGLTITELVAAFWTHAENYYRNQDSESTSELSCYREALTPLRRLYGHTQAAEFGPLALKAVRQAMIDANLCRTNINHRIGRIKRVFKWGTENELVPPEVFHGLQAVSGLKAGRSDARESVPVKPVPDERVAEVLPLVSRQVAAMIRLQQLAGIRSGEVVILRGIDIDMSGKLWVYRPPRHKTQYLGHDRIVFFGPRAQEILKQFLKPDVNAYLFSPVDAERERREKLHQERKTPLSCGNSPGTNVKPEPRKKPRGRYGVGSYGRAIKYACQRLYPLPERFERRRLRLPDLIGNGVGTYLSRDHAISKIIMA
ncbi:MAG: recombinase XerD [Tepidisphaeraceae bacterium]|jgi:integrase